MKSKAAGYSGTPLAKKLGIKDGFKIKIINAPDYYFDLFSDFPSEVKIITSRKEKLNFIHYFSRDTKSLTNDLLPLKKELQQNGMIWVSWYKKSSGFLTDLTGDSVREIGLTIGLVDIKVCAIDDKWSGLKFVIPVKDRRPG